MGRRHVSLTTTLGIATVIAATLLLRGSNDAVATHERPKSRMDTTVLDYNQPVARELSQPETQDILDQMQAC